MKTPREILLERHRTADHKLDVVRRNALAAEKSAAPECSPASWRDFFWSLRWHLAGMSAIWLAVMLLHLDTSRAPGMMASIPGAKIPPPQVIMASLRENRRQLSEMIEPQASAVEQRRLGPQGPRSERSSETLTA